MEFSFIKSVKKWRRPPKKPHGIAGLYPQPEDMEKYVQSQIYSVHYDELICEPYCWPKEDMNRNVVVPSTAEKSI
ncbi:unnamed protein product [Gongylonema pulchrum]|uniref:Uncharacterized protein n=1 Tax=Gongylonema pulchrum TaxID=637853 RepID=A0A183DHQ8_9BILA|nr:unnamed protein product [Gongylonema pulchrum]